MMKKKDIIVCVIDCDNDEDKDVIVCVIDVTMMKIKK